MGEPQENILPLKITVVIPVRNEEHSIGQLLACLNSQTLPPAEIVIADNGSSDRTADVIAGHESPIPVRLIRAGTGYPGRGRNLAAADASNEWIAFVDAGVFPEPDWLQSLAEPVETESNTEVVYGAYEPIIDTFFRECAAIAYVPAPLNVEGLPMRPRSIASALMRKDVWQAVGGFPEDLRSAEDLLFLSKIEAGGFRISFAPLAVVHWNIQPTFWKTFSRFVVYSRNNIRAGLWRSWQAKIFSRYALLLLLALPAFVLGRFWLLLSAILWLLMLLIRAIISIKRNSRCYPARLGRNLLRLLVLIPLMGVIDIAAIVGGVQWLLKDRSTVSYDKGGQGNKA